MTSSVVPFPNRAPAQPFTAADDSLLLGDVPVVRRTRPVLVEQEHVTIPEAVQRMEVAVSALERTGVACLAAIYLLVVIGTAMVVYWISSRGGCVAYVVAETIVSAVVLKRFVGAWGAHG